MTDWPNICDRCGTERYIGILYAGLCPDCHSDATREKLAGAAADASGQSALGDFE
jgi:NMD protein affecting ribosome stability and mRNA decay